MPSSTPPTILFGGAIFATSRISDTKQHIWCNEGNPYFPHPEKCKMCARLWADHPYDDTMSEEALMARDFPNNKRLM